MVVIIRSIDQKGFHFSLPILPISISCDLKQRKLGSSKTPDKQVDCDAHRNHNDHTSFFV